MENDSLQNDGYPRVIPFSQFINRKIIDECMGFFQAFVNRSVKTKKHDARYSIRVMGNHFKIIAGMVINMPDMPEYLKGDLIEGEIYPGQLHPDFCLDYVEKVFNATKELEMKHGRDPDAIVDKYFPKKEND